MTAIAESRYLGDSEIGWSRATEERLAEIERRIWGIGNDLSGLLGGGSSPTGAAGGDLAGTYPNPTVKRGTGSVSESTATAGVHFGIEYSTARVVLARGAGTNWGIDNNTDGMLRFFQPGSVKATLDEDGWFYPAAVDTGASGEVYASLFKTNPLGNTYMTDTLIHMEQASPTVAINLSANGASSGLGMTYQSGGVGSPVGTVSITPRAGAVFTPEITTAIPIIARGQTGTSVDLQQWQSWPTTMVARVTNTGIFDGSGYRVGNTPLAASHLSNGTTGTGAVVLAADPALTGNPTATTQAADNNSTRIATTAYVIGQASSTNPVMNGTVAIGTSLRYARADHVHPSDTSRQAADATLTALAAYNTNGLLTQTAADTFAGRTITGDTEIVVSNGSGVSGNPTLSIGAAIARLASPTFTGTPAAPTAAVDTNTTQIATTAYVVGQGYLKSATAASTYQPLDADLTSIAALTAAGFLVRTTGTTWIHRTVAGTAGQITVTNGDGVSGNPTISLPATITQATTVNGLTIADVTDTTKKVTFSVAGVTTGTTRTLTVPNANGTIALTSDLTSGYQPLDATLTALAAYNTNGILVQTAADTFAGRTITGDTEAVVANGSGVSGNPTLSIGAAIARLASPTFTGTPAAPTAAADTNTTQLATTAFVIAQASSTNPLMNGTVAIGTSLRYARADHVHPVDTSRQPLDATLTALAAFNSNGILTQTAADTFAARTITGTAGQISVSSGDGVSGNPTLSLPATITQATTFNGLTVADTTDTTKKVTFAVSGVTTGTTRTLTVPNANGTIALISDLTSGYQPLDATLTALAAYNTNGLLVQTAADTFAGRTLTGDAEIVVSNGSGVAGNPTLSIAASIARLASPTFTGTPAAPTAAVDTNTTQIATTAYVIGQGYLKSATAASTYQPLDADLTALAALSTTGMMARTASNTYTMRTITGTAGQVTVSNGDGVSGNPTLSLPTIITQGTTFTGTLAMDPGSGTASGIISSVGRNAGAQSVVMTLGAPTTGNGYVNASTGSIDFTLAGVVKATVGSSSLNIPSGSTYNVNGSQISTANLSDGSNVAHINATETISAVWTFGSQPKMTAGIAFDAGATVTQTFSGATLTFGGMSTIAAPAGSINASVLVDGSILASKIGFVWNGGNVIQNSTFGTGVVGGTTQGWTTPSNGTLAAETTVTMGVWNTGKVTATAAATDSILSTDHTSASGRASVVAGKTYTWSVFIRPMATNREYKVDVEWYNDANALQSTTLGTYVTNLATGTWTRIKTTGTAHANATHARLRIYQRSTNAGAGDVWYAGGPQLEMADTWSAFGPNPAEILPGTIQANMLRSAIVDADKLTAQVILTSQSIIAGSAGAARVELSGTNTDIGIYDASNVRRAKMDGASGVTLYDSAGTARTFLSTDGGLDLKATGGSTSRLNISYTGFDIYTSGVRRAQMSPTNPLILYDSSGVERVIFGTSDSSVRFHANPTTSDQVTRISSFGVEVIADGPGPGYIRAIIDITNGLRLWGETTVGGVTPDIALTQNTATGGLETHTSGADTGALTFDRWGLHGYTSHSTRDATTQSFELSRAGLLSVGVPSGQRMEADRTSVRFYDSSNVLRGSVIGGAVNAVSYSVAGVALAATHLSDGANIAHINATETISAAWTFTSGFNSKGVGTTGMVGMVGGDSSHAGYVHWFKSDQTTRLGYMGFDNVNLLINPENGAAVNVSASAMTALAAETHVFLVSTGGSKTFTTAPATQRNVALYIPTYAGTTAGKVITTAATLAIEGAPAAGTNMTLTNSYALWVQAGISLFSDTVRLSGASGRVQFMASDAVTNRWNIDNSSGNMRVFRENYDGSGGVVYLTFNNAGQFNFVRAGYFSSYTSDGVWGATALPGTFSTAGAGRLYIGYHDNGQGQYMASLGFSGYLDATNNTAASVGALNIIQSRFNQGVGVTLDTANRFELSANGTLRWGPGGSTSPNVNLSYLASPAALQVTTAFGTKKILDSAGASDFAFNDLSNFSITNGPGWAPPTVAARDTFTAVANELTVQWVFVPCKYTATGIRFRAGTTSGNCKVVIYNAAGNTILAGAPSTAVTGVGPISIDVPFSSTVALTPGWYLIGIVFDNATVTWIGSSALRRTAVAAAFTTVPSSVTLPNSGGSGVPAIQLY